MLSNEKKKPDNSIGDYKSFLHPVSSIQPLTRSKPKTDDMNESPLLFYITQCQVQTRRFSFFNAFGFCIFLTGSVC